MKISCCLIIRDEMANLEHCLQSVAPHVDEICILDTGSVDGSFSLALKYAQKIEQWTGCNGPDGRITDFSAARNRNLAMASHEAVFWIDGDDELVGGEHLRKLASEAPRGGTGGFAVVAPYEYAHDEAGRCTVLQWRERLVGPAKLWEWRGPVHEGLLGKPGCDPVHSQTDVFHVKHRRQLVHKPVDIERNLRILRAWFAANGESDARLMHYYGAELLQNRHIGEARRWLRRHVAMSNWSDERCLSLLHLARIELAFGDGEEAARFAVEAMTTKSWPEPMWVMGQAYLLLAEQGIDADHNLRRGVAFLERGFAQAGDGPTQTLLMTDPTARWEAHDALSKGLAKMGRLEEAVANLEAGLKGTPEHHDMKHNLKAWKPEVVRNRIRAGIVELNELGALEQQGGIVIDAVLRGEYKAQRREHPLFGQAKGRDEVPKSMAGVRLPEGKLRIAFWLGHQIEPWTPETLERDGMGGSETMAWELSRRLSKKGHAVHVFAHCEHSAIYDGVHWFDASVFANDMSGNYDILIVSRQCEAVTLPHTAKARVLWVHDVHCGPAFTPQIAVHYDFVWCLSNWHKEFFCQTYPWLNPDKVEVTRNGIDPGRFAQADSAGAIQRRSHRAIYSSSPDRGLAEAVAAWPAVRAAIPDAELHCYYGFDNWEKSLQHGENGIPHCSRAALEALKKAVAETEGVFMHGRVNQRELAEAMLGAGVWFYPTWFSETSCITAMEAQAAGLWCVCPPIAALAETVDYAACGTWDGDAIASVVKALQEKDGGPSSLYMQREQSQREFSLDTLADSWEARLNKLVTDATERVVPVFMEAAQ